ncbi:hypothetical protein DACRYDRAFT_24545 [Dacryopinax primogenitus]|uniref:R3H domain protein n=1 Tax=Dacryopinax primogenitus (strain DJM 731) TaxID=1858805 RepID=M5FPF8_DACPD|nr:uncharacterized protein DACRYDRAFT_24545 [Dacryopinax primogenitus]EJT98525.1 hypothetical protein DACRYDRAFT_24545 [Dacryopinax primogenitus]
MGGFGIPTPPPQQPIMNAYGYPQSAATTSPFSVLPNVAYSAPYSPHKKQVPRAALPAQWLESDNRGESRSLSPPNSLPSSGSAAALGAADFDLSSNGGSPPRMNGVSQPGMPPTPMVQTPNGILANGDEDIIPTAIVIKNIPFNVKRETLLDIIASLNIPTPYAFNYHLDALGAFRGLAFANFRQAADADAVVAALNGFDVQGRKLRVEYKKVLQAGEKERIEREKALRRMRSMGFDRPSPQSAIPPMPTGVSPVSPWGSPDGADLLGNMSGAPAPVSLMGGLGNGVYTPQVSLPQLQLPTNTVHSSGIMSSVSPPPVSSATSNKNEIDMNDPTTLDIYSRILLFKDDRMRDELAFSRTLTPKQRRTVHLIAQKLGVYHYSVGEGDDRYAVVTREPPEGRTPVRHSATLSRATSQNLLSPGDSTTPTMASLRLKKSMPTLRSSTLSSSPFAPSFLAAPGLSASATPTLSMRRSNSNLHAAHNNSQAGHFATISTSTPPRTRGSDIGALFGNPILPPVPVPPVPALPTGLGGGNDVLGTNPSSISTASSSNGASSVVRQPRGPSAAGGSGFLGRSRGAADNSQSQNNIGSMNGGLEATTHQPLEI